MSTYNRVVAADVNASLAPAIRARLATEMADPTSEVGAPLVPLRNTSGVRPPRIATTITTFAAGHGFTVLGGAANAQSFADDAIDFAIGSQSVAVEPSITAPTSIQSPSLPATDTTGSDVAITVKIDDTTNVTELILYAAMDVTFANYYQWTFPVEGLESQRLIKSGEWVTITASFGDAAAIGAPTRNGPTVFRLRARTTEGTTTKFRFNRIGLVSQAATPVVSICTDDIYASTWTHLRPILDRYGFSATVYAIPERAIPSIVSIDRLHQLEDVNGWEIAGHGLTGFLEMASVAEAEADAVKSKRWLQSNGFRGPDHYAYVGGQFSPEIERMMRKYFRSCRSISARQPLETQPPSNAYRIRSMSVSNTTPVATVTAAITNAVASNSWFVWTLHDIVDGAAGLGTQYSAADVDAICAHIASLGVQVKLLSAVLSER